VTQAKQGRQLTRGERIKRLRIALGQLMDGVPNQTEFSSMVGKEERRPKGGYDASTIHRWEEKDAAPDLSAIEAMARIAYAHGLRYACRAWLAFGDDGVQEARDAETAPALRVFPGGKIRLAGSATFAELTPSKSDAKAGGSK
jgi:transcriptional regulator with XRE-family HTH domain